MIDREVVIRYVRATIAAREAQVELTRRGYDLRNVTRFEEGQVVTVEVDGATWAVRKESKGYGMVHLTVEPVVALR